MTKKIAVVVMSGGQDSTTCLGLALAEYDEVHCITFAYGQKHAVEIGQATAICALFSVPITVMKIPMLQQLGDSALIKNNDCGNDDVTKPHHRSRNLPASFVPNRNALFLTTAHAFAQKVGAEAIITGVCETDYSGYPDCRQQFIMRLEDALNVGYQTSIEIRTPLMFLNKAQTFELAETYGFLEVVLEHSHTCYNGDRSITHIWGKGCGKCPACELRAKGFEEFQQFGD